MTWFFYAVEVKITSQGYGDLLLWWIKEKVQRV